MHQAATRGIGKQLSTILGRRGVVMFGGITDERHLAIREPPMEAFGRGGGSARPDLFSA